MTTGTTPDTILLVEDEAGVRHLARRILEGRGYRVLEAADGAEAERVFAQHADTIDLVVTDVLMPGCDGPELVARLLAKTPALRVMYMSGYTERSAALKAAIGRGIPFVKKPFTAAEFAQHVRDALDREHTRLMRTVCDTVQAVERVSYRVDGLDHITGVGGDWAAFAALNGAARLADGVIGRSLWDFVSDITTRQVYHDLLARVRVGRTATFDFRCDAPALRRFLRMTMTPSHDSGVDFDSVTIRTETRVPSPLTAELSPRGGAGLLRMCSWCKRVDVAGEWHEMEVAVERLGLFGGRMPELTHAMCRDCLARVMGDLDALPAVQ